MADKTAKVDPIGPANYDPWVYKHSREGMPAQVQHAQKSVQSLAEDSIGATGYNSQVHDFTQETFRGYNERANLA